MLNINMLDRQEPEHIPMAQFTASTGQVARQRPATAETQRRPQAPSEGSESEPVSPEPGVSRVVESAIARRLKTRSEPADVLALVDDDVYRSAKSCGRVCQRT